MRFSDKIFLKHKPNFTNLISYGFELNDNYYSYKKKLDGLNFQAEINVSLDEIVYSKIIDLEFNEEYEAVNVESFNGDFVSKVKEEYKNILLDIRNKCFLKVPFISAQANRIANLIFEKYNEEPDFPFKKLEDCGVFRYKDNGKWYGLIMNIKGALIDKNIKNEIDVLNVKIDFNNRDDLLKLDGIYNAYHMNKKGWISISLNEKITDDFIMNLIDYSRTSVLRKIIKKNK